MAQPITKDTEQYISNKSFDSDYNLEIVKGMGYSSDDTDYRPIAVDSNGKLKVTI